MSSPKPGSAGVKVMTMQLGQALTALLRSLGLETVTVGFELPPVT